MDYLKGLADVFDVRIHNASVFKFEHLKKMDNDPLTIMQTLYLRWLYIFPYFIFI